MQFGCLLAVARLISVLVALAGASGGNKLADILQSLLEALKLGAVQHGDEFKLQLVNVMREKKKELGDDYSANLARSLGESLKVLKEEGAGR